MNDFSENVIVPHKTFKKEDYPFKARKKSQSSEKVYICMYQLKINKISYIVTFILPRLVSSMLISLDNNKAFNIFKM